MAAKTQNETKNAFIPSMEQMTEAMRQVYTDSMANMRVMNEDMSTMRQESMSQMKVMAEDMAQMTKATMDYQVNLMTEWQRLSMEMMQSFGAKKG